MTKSKPQCEAIQIFNVHAGERCPNEGKHRAPNGQRVCWTHQQASKNPRRFGGPVPFVDVSAPTHGPRFETMARSVAGR